MNANGHVMSFLVHVYAVLINNKIIELNLGKIRVCRILGFVKIQRKKMTLIGRDRKFGKWK